MRNFRQFAAQWIGETGARGIHFEDEIETGEAAFHEGPLVDATRAFHQQRFGVDRRCELTTVGMHVGFERPDSLRPREEREHRFFDQDAQFLVDDITRAEARLDDQFTDAASRLLHLLAQRVVELILRDMTALDKRIAEAITPVDNRAERNFPALEEDGPELGAIHNAETAGFLAEREQLQDVGKTRLFEAAANSHQSASSIRRAVRSGQRCTKFSRSPMRCLAA